MSIFHHIYWCSTDLKVVEDECIEKISKAYKLGYERARMLFEQVWIFTFGLATLSAMKVYEYTEEQNLDMLACENLPELL